MVVYEECVREVNYLLLVYDLVLYLKPTLAGLLFLPHVEVELVALLDNLSLDLLLDIIDSLYLAILNVEVDVVNITLQLGYKLLIKEDVDHLRVKISA